MMTLLLIAGYGLLLMFATWVGYLAVMNLMENRAKLTLATKLFAYPLAAAGLVLDAVSNLLIGTVLFLEPPHEILLTKRLQRQIETGRPWRANLAHWLCSNLLDPFDSRGYHCQKPK